MQHQVPHEQDERRNMAQPSQAAGALELPPPRERPWLLPYVRTGVE
jgi:hypothetical protein